MAGSSAAWCYVKITTSLPDLRTRGLTGIRQRHQRMAQAQGRGSVYPADEGRCSLIGWRAFCSSFRIMPFRPRKLSAFALIVAVVAAASSILIAQAAQPEACVMTPHDCADTPKVADCCCHFSDATHQGGPIESRVQLAVDLSPHPVALPAGAFADTSASSLHVQIPPPSSSPSDFTTRSAPLLI